jgi:hypothetical protein
VNRSRIGRLFGILAAAVLILTAVGFGTATARTPNWTIDVVRLPTSVAGGNDAGYFATVKNNGPSNINALTLTVTPASTPNATPSYFSGLAWSVGGPGSCTATGKLVCTLGTVNAGVSISFTVAYGVPANQSGSFDVEFSLKAATGDTGSDHGGTSRGDSFSKVAKTGVSSNANVDGGFVVGDTAYADNQSVGRNNKQATSLTSPETLIPVTIEDGITTGVNCTGAACAGVFGEWSKMSVANGKTYGAPFKVTLLVWGGAVPGGTKVEDVKFVHVLDDGTTEVISQACTPSTGTPTNAECLTVTKVGKDFKIVVWLFKNGFGRGGI